MAKFIRYALVSLCFAVSVSCFAMWGCGFTVEDRLAAPQYFLPARFLLLECCKGYAIVTSADQDVRPSPTYQRIPQNSDVRLAAIESRIAKGKQFCVVGRTLYFPLWYPAIVLASMGVGVLRLGNRFTIRSMILTTTVISLLLGIPFVF